jgi:acyl-CoA synthetase (AMP-forming)/AMP-acid ligase II
VSDAAPQPSANIASKLSEMAKSQPYAPAIFYPYGRASDGHVTYTHFTYKQLDDESNAIAAGLEAYGIGPGIRTVLMVKPSLEFFSLVFGIFKAGAVPVVVDPGIGLKSLKQCLEEAEPTAFIGISTAHVARVVLGWSRSTIKQLVTVGSRWFWGGKTLAEVKALGAASTDWTLSSRAPDDVAAVLFTSGSTGVPKGVIYRHGNFMAQVEMIRDAYDIQPGEIDLPTFPLFALFDPALGMTTIVPDMDPRKPASVDPRKIIEAVKNFGVTNMFGSPALLNTVSKYGAENGITLPTLRRVISAGAPVSARVMARTLKMLPAGATINTPYGATESLPIATASSDEILGETAALTDQGKGVCVGKPVERANVRVIRISDEPICVWSDELEVETGEVGEITVAGPMVTREYYNRPRHNALSKIVCPKGDFGFRHRMGDLGYMDPEGRIWFCGRKAHRVTLHDGEVLYTIPCEGVFNAHAKVYRSALVSVARGGEASAALCVELEPGESMTPSELKAEMSVIAAAHAHTQRIGEFHLHSAFPVDIRHNAKIGREKLSDWAQGQA